MGLKLNYNLIQTFTSVDISDFAADPPFYFEYRVNPSDKLREAALEFLESGEMQDVELAKAVIKEGIISIRQGEEGEKFTLDTLEAVAELRDAIEEMNEGQGDKFIVELALRFYILLRRRQEVRLGESGPSLEGSINGAQTEQETLVE